MIKFVYFDVGGVVIKDFSGTNKWEELRQEIGVTVSNKDVFDKIWGAHKDTHSTTFDVDNLNSELQKHFDVPKDYSLLMAFVNRFEKNELIWPIISQIKKEVPVGLLTNMYPRMLSKIYEAKILPNVEWDIVVDSSVEKLKKPDRDFFELAEKRAKVAKYEILFIDNSESHLKAAKEFGWQTFLYNPKNHDKSCEDLLIFFNTNK